MTSTFEKNVNDYRKWIDRDRDFYNYPKFSGFRTVSCRCDLCQSDPKLKNKKTTSTVNDKLLIDTAKVASEAIKLLISKHNDYGSRNISEAPGGAINGLAVRLHDKVERLANLTSNNRKPNNESIRDTFIDILNYSIIAIMVLDGTWESTK